MTRWKQMTTEQRSDFIGAWLIIIGMVWAVVIAFMYAIPRIPQ